MTPKPRILYVDDEFSNLLIFKQIFKEDFEVTTTDSPHKALEIIAQNEFEIAIADQRMPKMLGTEFLEKVYSSGIDSIRILLTGYSDMKATTDSINKGHIYFYCSKPWKKDELTAVFLKALEYLRLERGNKKLLASLSATVKELDAFLYRTSHNLKTPITTQLGLLNLLKHDTAKLDPAILNQIQETIESLKGTIEKMQMLSEAGYQFMKMQHQVDLQDIVEQIISENQAIIDQKKIVIEQHIESLQDFISDAHSIRAILLRILKNSFEYMRDDVEGNRVVVTATCHPISSVCQITIEDNGTGIEPARLQSIFDFFSLEDQSSSDIGFGLYVVKRIIDMLSGKIEISSDGNTGTKVKLEIPSM